MMTWILLLNDFFFTKMICEKKVVLFGMKTDTRKWINKTSGIGYPHIDDENWTFFISDWRITDHYNLEKPCHRLIHDAEYFLIFYYNIEEIKKYVHFIRENNDKSPIYPWKIDTLEEDWIINLNKFNNNPLNYLIQNPYKCLLNSILREILY